MGQLQETFEAELAALPRAILKDLLKEKLQAIGVRPDRALVDALSDHIMLGSGEPFTRSHSRDHIDEQLTFTDDDLARVERAFLSAADEITPLIEETSARFKNSLDAQWQEEDRKQRRAEGGFHRRLSKRWGRAFSLLRMLLTTAREIGSARLDPEGKLANGGAVARYVLRELHARSCQITDEIIVLLEHGFADGAMARWRTLHEVSVVAALVQEFGDDIAQRYIDHDAIESKRALSAYEQCYAELGYDPPTDEERAVVEQRYDAAIALYEKSFAGGYGWAAHHLGHKDPTFRDIERAAQKARLRSHYKMASQQVHAGVKGTMTRLGALNGEPMLSGPSNAGFFEPGQNTAITLVQTTASLLFDQEPTLDELVFARALIAIKDDAINALQEASDELDRDNRSTPVQDGLLDRFVGLLRRFGALIRR